MKKLIILILIVFLAFASVSCTPKSQDEDGGRNDTEQTTPDTGENELPFLPNQNG